MITFTIDLPPITKKNHSQVISNPKTGRIMVIPSKQYKEYERNAKWFMPRIETITTPINIEAHFYMPTRRRVDLVNLLQALCDILVKYEVIEDDNSSVVASFDAKNIQERR